VPLSRAIADQIDGQEEQHATYRQSVVDYVQVQCMFIGCCNSLQKPLVIMSSGSTINKGAVWLTPEPSLSLLFCCCCSTLIWVHHMQEHREEFEPFVEDEVPFNEYCSAMREDGTWAGHMELQATSLVTGCNICIHQVKAAMLFTIYQKEYGFTVGKWWTQMLQLIITTSVHLVLCSSRPPDGTFAILKVFILLHYICEFSMSLSSAIWFCIGWVGVYIIQ
jgi:hypothetical protein